MARKNSRTFAWSESMMSIDGQDITEFVAIEWDETQEMEYVYGKGNEPLKISAGNISYTGNVTFLQGGLEEVLDRAPERKLTKLKNVSIQIAFVEEDGGEMMRHSITGVRFQSNPRSIRQNDKHMEVSCPFMALSIRSL